MCHVAHYLLAVLAVAVVRLPAATVTSCDEASLRAAIAQGGLVQFACDGIITLSETLEISGGTSIDGTGRTVTINGSNSVRLFYVSGGVVTLSNLTLAGGLAPTLQHGGAIFSSWAELTVSGCTFTNNRSSRWGGAIYAEDAGSLNIVACTFVDNRAEYGASVAMGTPTTISQSTFHRNSATLQGGALWAFSSSLDVVNSTFVANQANSSGTIRHASPEPASIRHCTFIQNLPDSNPETANPILLRVTNCIVQSSGGLNFYDANRNLRGGFESLGVGTLGNYGGPTATVPLLPGSPAIDAGLASACLGFDQRSHPRRCAVCDIGAFELEQGTNNRVRFEFSVINVREDASNVVLRIRREDSTAQSMTVNAFTRDGTALAGTHYVPTNVTLVFDSCESERELTITILNNDVLQGNLSFQVGLSNVAGSAEFIAPTNCVVGITEDESAGSIVFAATSYSVSETQAMACISLVRTGGSVGPVSVEYAFTDITATAGADYVSTPVTVYFAAGQITNCAIIRILDDALFDRGETFRVYLRNPQGGAGVGTPGLADVTIVDDDLYGLLSFDSGAYTTMEGNASVRLPLIRTEGSVGEVSTDYFCTDGTAGAQDYVTRTGTVYFAQGQTSNHIDILLRDDTTVEGNEIFYVSFVNLKGGAIPGRWGATVITIVEDDSEILFSAPSYSVPESNILSLPMVRRGYLSNEASVQFQTSDITAVAGQDYADSNGTIIFAPGQVTNLVNVTILDDVIEELRETFAVSLFDPVGSFLGQPSNTVVAIGDVEAVAACDDRTLHDAVAIGRKVIFTCDGTIVLGSTISISHDVLLDGQGHNVRIRSPGRVFNIASNANVTLRNLSLVDSGVMGRAWLPPDFPNREGFDGYGGAIANTGRLAVVNCVFSNTYAAGVNVTYFYPYWLGATAGRGGAIHNGGDLSVSNCMFVSNFAVGGDAAPDAGFFGGGPAGAVGGAIYNLGTARVWDSTFETNYVRGGSAVFNGGAHAVGAAIFTSGPLDVFRCNFTRNHCVGGRGGPGAGGGAAAGALWVDGARVTIGQCTFDANRATGGIASDGVSGRGAAFGRAEDGGGGGAGGNAMGAAIYLRSATANIANSTFFSNSVVGPDGGPGGNGGSGDYPRGVGGNGGPGGHGGNVLGADLRVESSTLLLMNNTLARSSAVAGIAGTGGVGGGSSYPFAPPGSPGPTGLVGVVFGHSISATNSTLRLLNSIVAASSSNALCWGTLVDDGYNICSDATCLFTNVTSINTADPMLTDLNDFGGRIKTLALLPGSPALNAGSPVIFPVEDQRGVPRPQGSRCDIGAFEAAALYFSRSVGDAADLAFFGFENQAYQLETSSDLLSWTQIETGLLSYTGWQTFSITVSNSRKAFFRVLLP